MPFQKYQSEQVQQIAPGFVEAYGKAGAAIGQGLASIGSSIAQGMDEAEKRRLEEAKLKGIVTPYINSEIKNVETSLGNGLLQKGKDGKVSVMPGQEENLDMSKVSRAIDLYNQTEGGKKTLKAEELTGIVSTIQSYDTLEKQAADRVAAARKAKLDDLEYNTKLLSNSVTLSQGIAAFATQKRGIAAALAMQGDTTGAQAMLAESNALSDKSQSVLFDAYKSAGIDVSAYLPPPAVQPPSRPAAVAVGSGASTLYTVTTPAPSVSPTLTPTPAPSVTAPASAAPAVQTTAPTSAPAAGAVTTPTPTKPVAATARNLQLGTLPAVQPTSAPGAEVAKPAPAAIGKPDYVVQAETEIASLKSAKIIYEDLFKKARVNRAMVGLNADEVKSWDKQANDANEQARKIDDAITEKMKALTAEQARVDVKEAQGTKLGMEQAKAMDDRLPDFGQGYMAAGRAKAFKLYPDDPAKALTDVRISGIKGESKEITDTIGSIGSFMEGTMAIESAIDSRLEEGKGYFDRFTLTSTDYDNIAKGNVGEKILLASMRKAIVSGGNFSDADRTFVLEAIASINSLDPTKRNEYFKSLNKVMAGMVFKMYDGKLKSMGVERHLELLSPEDQATAVSDTERAFRARFGIDDSGSASEARASLSALIKDSKKDSGFASSRAQAESAVATFIDKAKAERALADKSKK